MSNKPSLSSGMPNKLNDKKANFRKVQLRYNTLQFFLSLEEIAECMANN